MTTDRPTTAADRLRDWINGDRSFTHAEPNRWLDEALAEARQPDSEALRRALEDFVRWADEWIMAKEQREAYKFTPGEVPPASFAERPHLLNSQLVYLREQARAVLQAPQSESRAVELLRALSDAADDVRYQTNVDHYDAVANRVRAFLADSAAPPARAEDVGREADG